MHIFKKLLLTLFLSVSPAFGASLDVGGSWRGLNDGDSAILIGDNESQDLSNVDITDSGYGIKKRDGYASYKSLTVSTSGVVGGYYFRDASGVDNIIHAHNVYVSKSAAGAAYSNFITTETLGAYADFVDSQGYLYRANSSRDEIWRYDGSAVTYYSSHPKGDQIEVLPDRLVISGTSANPNRINFSKQADFTDFTTGNTSADGWTDDITLPGQSIKCLKYALGQLIAWTRTSTIIGTGENQFDFSYEDISATVGCDQPNSVLYDSGQVFWQAQDRHFYAYDGNQIRRISQKIAGSVEGFANGESKSWEQTTESDFESGTHSQTSDDVSEGNVVLNTWTDTDTSAEDFGAGSVSNTSTTTVSGSVYLATNNTNVENNSFESGVGISADNWTLDAVIQAPNATTVGTPKDGSRHIFFGSYVSYTIYLLDSSGGTLTSAGYTANVGTYTQRSISTASYAGRWIKIKYLDSAADASLTSDLFLCSGNTITWWDKGSSGPTGFYIDLVEGGRSTTYSGTFTSGAFDTAFTTAAWLSSSANSTANSHSITWQTQASSDASSWDTAVSWTPGSAPTSAWKRYIRYVVTLSTGGTTNGTALPYVDDVTFSARAATGTFISQIKNIGTTPSSWGNFTADQTLNSGTITYYIKTASTSGGVSAASRTALTRGSQITATLNQYFLVEADFSVNGTATNVPTMANFVVNWNEGIVSRTWGSVDKNHRLMWAVAEDASSVPNATYIYDQRFDTWLKYSAPLVGPARVGDSIYFGSPSAGTVYQYPSGTTDAGTAITAYWKSKDFIGGDPHSEKEWNAISVIAKSDAGSNYDVVYSSDTVNSATANVSLTSSIGASRVQYNENFPFGIKGLTFSVKFGNDDSDSPFEIYAFRLDYQLLPWRVLP